MTLDARSVDAAPRHHAALPVYGRVRACLLYPLQARRVGILHTVREAPVFRHGLRRCPVQHVPDLGRRDPVPSRDSRLVRIRLRGTRCVRRQADSNWCWRDLTDTQYVHRPDLQSPVRKIHAPSSCAPRTRPAGCGRCSRPGRLASRRPRRSYRSRGTGSRRTGPASPPKAGINGWGLKRTRDLDPRNDAASSTTERLRSAAVRTSEARAAMTSTMQRRRANP